MQSNIGKCLRLTDERVHRVPFLSVPEGAQRVQRAHDTRLYRSTQKSIQIEEVGHLDTPDYDIRTEVAWNRENRFADSLE